MQEEFWSAIDNLVADSQIIIDRPKRSVHPRYPQIVYKVDYGYLAGTSSADGAEIDVWVGTGEKKAVGIICTVDLLKRDSEIKILIGCTEREMEEIYRFHNETQGMKGLLIRR